MKSSDYFLHLSDDLKIYENVAAFKQKIKTWKGVNGSCKIMLLIGPSIMLHIMLLVFSFSCFELVNVFMLLTINY